VFNTLVRTNLPVQIAQELVAYIEREQLQPNDLIPSTADLAESFGVSKPVIREALKLLEARSIIKVTNGKRAVVKPLSSEPLVDFFERMVKLDKVGFRTMLEVREAIETQNAMLAAQRRSPEQIAAMQALTAEMRRNLHNLETFVELDVALHLLVAQASQNSVLEHLTSSIRAALKVIMLAGRLRRSHERETLEVQELHEALVAAIERGDGEAAAAVMRRMFADQHHYLAE
jgi:GntR family transcriptional regulator, transcriptional repressor for pyruvate dehydrogenase complex